MAAAEGLAAGRGYVGQRQPPGTALIYAVAIFFFRRDYAEENPLVTLAALLAMGVPYLLFRSYAGRDSW